MAMAVREEDLSFSNKRTSDGDDHQVFKSWMMQDELVQDHYLNCFFENEPPHVFHKGALILTDMASTPAAPPFPSPPSSPLNIGQISSRPIGETKSLQQTDAIRQQPKINGLHENPGGLGSYVSMSSLSSTNSNIGLICHHPPISLYAGKELPNSANSSDCSMKTQNKSMECPLTAESDPKFDGDDCSPHRNICGIKRSRVPEDHNKSEKMRRDKINEKMRTLQQLIPNSRKNGKSSTLDEAIEYMKYLKFQIQVLEKYLLMQRGMGPMPAMLSTGMQAPRPYYQLPYLQQKGLGTRIVGMDMAMEFGVGIDHPWSLMANIHGQRTFPSQELQPKSSFINAASCYLGIESSSTFNTLYGTEFSHIQKNQQ